VLQGAFFFLSVLSFFGMVGVRLSGVG